MRFVRHNKFFLVFLASLVICSVLVIRQFLVNQWEHIDLREDFILLHDEGQTRGTERLYQMLIQELPSLPARALLDDEQRLDLIQAQKHLPPADLVWKYRVSVQNELQRRTDERVARALKRAGVE
jgi:hypothetical protein